MSDDLTAELGRSQNAYVFRAADGYNSIAIRTSDEELAECYRLMAEARDEIARLRAHVEQLLNACEAADETIDMLKAERTRMTGDMGTDLRMLYGYELGRDTTLAEIAALDAGDALNVGPDTTGEGT